MKNKKVTVSLTREEMVSIRLGSACLLTALVDAEKYNAGLKAITHDKSAPLHDEHVARLVKSYQTLSAWISKTELNFDISDKLP
jgi:hypothetical protein